MGQSGDSVHPQETMTDLLKQMMREGDTDALFSLYYRGDLAQRVKAVAKKGVDELYEYCLEDLGTSEMHKAYMEVMHMERSVQKGPKLMRSIRRAKHGDANSTNEAIEIIEKEYANSTNCTDAAGNTLLHMASAVGNARVVKELLRRGAPCRVGNKYGETPLHLAARERHPRCVEALLNALRRDNAAVQACKKRGDCGFENKMVNRQYNHAQTPIEAAVASPRVNMRVVDLLAPTSSVEGALGAATVRDDVATLKAMYERFPELTATTVVDAKRRQTVLHKACLNGAVKCLEFLVDKHSEEAIAKKKKKKKISRSLDEYLLLRDVHRRNAFHCLADGRDDRKAAACFEFLLHRCDYAYGTKKETVRDLLKAQDTVASYTTMVRHRGKNNPRGCWLVVARYLWRHWRAVPEKKKILMSPKDMEKYGVPVGFGDRNYLRAHHKKNIQLGSRHGAKHVDDCTPLHLAIVNGHDDAFSVVLDYLREKDDPFMVHAVFTFTDSFGNTFAHTAALFDRWDIYTYVWGESENRGGHTPQDIEAIEMGDDEEEWGCDWGSTTEEEEDSEEEGDCSVWWTTPEEKEKKKWDAATSAACDLRLVGDSLETRDYVDYPCD